MYFLKHHRPLIKQQHPEVTFADLGKTIGAMWKAVTPEEKEQYEELAVADKQRFATEMAAYKLTQQHAGAAAVGTAPEQAVAAQPSTPSEASTPPAPSETSTPVDSAAPAAPADPAAEAAPSAAVAAPAAPAAPAASAAPAAPAAPAQGTEVAKSKADDTTALNDIPI